MPGVIRKVLSYWDLYVVLTGGALFWGTIITHQLSEVL